MIENLRGKIGVLERRAEHLQRKLDRADYAATHSAEFDRAEISALTAALTALRFVELLSSPETSPLVALRRLVTAIDHGAAPDVIAAAAHHARITLGEIRVLVPGVAS